MRDLINENQIICCTPCPRPRLRGGGGFARHLPLRRHHEIGDQPISSAVQPMARSRVAACRCGTAESRMFCRRLDHGTRRLRVSLHDPGARARSEAPVATSLALEGSRSVRLAGPLPTRNLHSLRTR